MGYTTSKTLLRQIQAGDETAWYNFYSIYAPLIRYCGQKYGIDYSEMDDLVQNVMLKFSVKSALERYDVQQGKFRTYMGRIIHNAICDMKRKHITNADYQGDTIISDDIQQLVEAEWKAYAYKEALFLLRQQVSEDTYQAFQMLTEHEQTPQKVAEFLNMPLQHVYVAKARCKRILVDIVKMLDE